MAAWIAGLDSREIPAVRFERLKQHIADTMAARLAGSRLPEGEAVSRVLRGDTSIGAAIAAGCAHARCTEVDDIHLTSCTTPGAVIVPAALALAGRDEMRVMREFCAAVLVGYEALIRFGVAIDGPAVLHRHIWPTHAAAAFGCAAMASRAYGLTADQTAGALATALAFGSGPPVSAAAPSSARWLTLGVAAANGELAARAARDGLRGVSTGVAVDAAPLTSGLGRRYLFDDTGMKPFPTARQGLAAIEAAQDIARADALTPSDIDRIVVRLPEPQRRIVDRPGMPSSRFESIVSVQYQIALALAAPERLMDVRRTRPFNSAGLRKLISKVRVQRARDLDAEYPQRWPARVEIHAGRQRFSRLALHARGDANRPLDWNQIAEKFAALAGTATGGPAVRRTLDDIREATPSARIPALWSLT